MPVILPAVLIGVGFFAVLVLTLMYVGRRLRARGRAAIDERFPAAEVLRSETMAQSYGEQSRGAAQARGSGALALTKGELFFLLYVPERELRVPLSSIQATAIVRSHLGKTSGVKLLKVTFTTEDGEDAVAWRVPDPDAWRAELDALRG